MSSYTANQQNPEAVSFAKHYDHRQHKFENSLLGEIRLPVPIFQLVPPSLETLSSPKALTSQKDRTVSFAFEPAQALLLELKSYQLQFTARKVNRKQALLRAIRDLKDLNFTPEDFLVYSKHMSLKPYAEPLSKQFLIACKVGDDWTARRMLELNPYLIHVFDSTHLTGLHWAAKRNHIPLLILLTKRKALLNARDQVSLYQKSGQTPLFHAVKAGAFDAVRELLCRKADPKRESVKGETVLKIANDMAMLAILKRAVLVLVIQLETLLKFAPKEKRDAVWKEEGLKYFHLDTKILKRRW